MSATKLDKTTLEILKSLPFGVYFCDRDCIVRYINEPYAKYLGYSPQEIIGRKITDFIPHSRAEAVMRSGQAEMYQQSSVISENSSAPILVNRMPMRDANGVIVGFISQLLSVGKDGWGNVWDQISEINRTLDKVGERTGQNRNLIANEIITADTKMYELLKMAARYALAEEPVLITGPTGAGKELFARAVQRASKRSKAPFICVNCASIPRDFINSELFGYAAGAFTGARKEGKAGLMELADKGTLFLDEIGELPLESQGALLRVLETGQLQRLNSLSVKKVDFRLICATNRNLHEMTKTGSFREDLFFRLAVLPLHIPPLRERGKDLALLIRHFLKIKNLNEKLEKGALKILLGYHWPGNVRELRNALIYAEIASQGRKIQPGDLPLWIRAGGEAAMADKMEPPHKANARSIDSHEVERTLRACGGNVSQAAKKLGISRTTLYARIKDKASLDSN